MKNNNLESNIESLWQKAKKFAKKAVIYPVFIGSLILSSCSKDLDYDSYMDRSYDRKFNNQIKINTEKETLYFDVYEDNVRTGKGFSRNNVTMIHDNQAERIFDDNGVGKKETFKGKCYKLKKGDNVWYLVNNGSWEAYRSFGKFDTKLEGNQKAEVLKYLNLLPKLAR